MDATFFRDPVIQYDSKSVDRELIKAYAAFRPRPTAVGAENLFGIATGNWGCGVFNGDKQLKGI
jgi:poly(ADP-ribose) glycohydrolase